MGYGESSKAFEHGSDTSGRKQHVLMKPDKAPGTVTEMIKGLATGLRRGQE